MKEKLGEESSRDAVNVATDSETDEVCEKYGNLCIILDACISFIYNTDDYFTDEQVGELEQRLKVLLKKWVHMGLSITPKCHVLLDHITKQVKYIEGFKTMCEDRMERSHQDSHTIRANLARMRNKTQLLNSQAKLQNISVMKSVKDIQEQVTRKSRRNLKRKTSLKTVNDLVKKQEREDIRNDKLSMVSNDGELVGNALEYGRHTIKKSLQPNEENIHPTNNE